MTIEMLKEMLVAMPLLQQVALALFLAVGVIGGNYVFIRHNRRRGRAAMHGWNVIGNLREFDRSDWAWLASVFAVAFALIGVAMLAG